MNTQPAYLSRSLTDVLRIVSMFMVLVIHATGPAEMRFTLAPLESWNDTLSVFLNQIGRFCVPLFLFLSGYGLEARQQKNPDEKLMDFYKGRALKVLLPLITWSVILYTALHAPKSIPEIWNYLRGLGIALIQVRADYHVYFLAFLLQCYLLFPLFRRYAWTSLIIALVCAAVLYSPGNGWVRLSGIEMPSVPSRAFIKWFYAFCAGILTARYGIPWASQPGMLKKITSLLLFGLTSFWVLSDYTAKARTGMSVDWYNHFARYSVAAHLFATVYLCAVWAQSLEKIASGALSGWVKKISAWSFVIYLGHTMVLRGIKRITPDGWELVNAVILFAVMTALAWSIDRFVKKQSLRDWIGIG